jgi:hypothetical protein
LRSSNTGKRKTRQRHRGQQGDAIVHGVSSLSGTSGEASLA